MSLTAEPDAADPLCLVVECSWGFCCLFWTLEKVLQPIGEVGTVLNSSRRDRKAKQGELTNSAGFWLMWGELWVCEPQFTPVFRRAMPYLSSSPFLFWHNFQQKVFVSMQKS